MGPFKRFNIFGLNGHAALAMSIIFLGITFGLLYKTNVLAQLNTAPKIFGVKVQDITADKITVVWETDKEADSLINYGLNKNYGMVRDPLSKKSHTLVIDQLDPSTTYHFRIVSSDSLGNQSISGNYKVTTGGREDIPNIDKVVAQEERSLVERVYAALEEVTDEEALTIIAEKVKDVATSVTPAPSLIGIPNVTVGITTAVVAWTTDQPASSMVSFVPEYQYQPFLNNPYTFNQSSVGAPSLEHRVELIGLLPATTYHFQASSEGRFGLTGKSQNGIFTTKAAVPEIYNIDIEKLEEDAATISWGTTVLASSLVEYTNLETGQTKSIGSPMFTLDHLIRITELDFGTEYQAVVVVHNEGGDRVEGEPFTFITIKDESPPVITSVTNESTLYPGSESRIQTLVSWDTDEPSYCSLNYREGLATGVEPRVVQNPNQTFAIKHVQVITEFRPATVYKFWVNCEDRSGNRSKSEDFVLFTPQQEKSIIDIILENFEGTFGWVKNITN